MTIFIIFETKDRLDIERKFSKSLWSRLNFEKGFYDCGFVNLRKCAKGEGFVDDCSQCWQNCVPRRNGIEFAGFGGIFVQDFTDSFFFLSFQRRA